MSRIVRTLAPLIALMALATGTVSAAEAPAAKWRLQFQGKATTEGELHFRLTPQTGEPILVTIKINAGRGEMFMAKDVLAGFKEQLKLPRFKSEIVHGQEVLLKAGHDEPAFVFELVDSTVAGPKLHISPG